jgi:murein DD-endopeptidase MepM/ murein hydrolase activator NlpD
MVMGDSSVEAVVALSEMGRYVSVVVSSINTPVSDASNEEEDDGNGAPLYQSIYETALRNQIPRPVIESLIRIYSYDVDFQQKAQPGDSIDVLYATDDETSGSDTKNEVMFAELTVGGEVKKYFRFQTTDDGIVDFYDETGKSAKKFLVRKPVAAGTMRSGSGPITAAGCSDAYRRRLAAPLGTAIYASGNGIVDKVGWESGYGKYVRIRHANGYETAYGHMTAFARLTQPGARVRQGQVIGYVGSTGLSTGPHVHYEVMVNGRFVDPLRVRLPRGRVLEGQLMASFDKERDRLAGIIARSPRVAQPKRCGEKRRPLFCDDGVTQRERLRDAMQVLDTGPGPFDVDRAVAEHTPRDRLGHIHRFDLVHVHFRALPPDETFLVNDALICHRKLGDPADEPGSQE